MKRQIKEKLTGYRTTDGAGVSLVRVLGRSTVDLFDPILMLDSFDSENPEDYIKGFPMHPHRGIETVSFLSKGNMIHRDSLGNEDSITDGEVQWMTAGSGILHEETLPASKKMLGVQIWLNLPRENKMAKPEYKSIKNNEMEIIDIEGGTLKLISGQYKEYTGHTGKYLPLDFYDINLNENTKFEIDMENDKSILVFLLKGSGKIAGELIPEKTAVKLTEGTKLEIETLDEKLELLYLSSDRLDEPVSWGGPIVMNTDEELDLAFRELQNGNFIKEEMNY